MDPAEKPLPPDRKRNRSDSKRRQKKGNPQNGFDLRREAYKRFGVDVTQIPGVETIALPLFSEVGRDLSKWPAAAHFSSWLALCPDNDISGGRVLLEGGTQNKEPSGATVPPRRAFPSSYPHPTGKLSPPDESKAGSGCCPHRYRT